MINPKISKGKKLSFAALLIVAILCVSMAIQVAHADTGTLLQTNACHGTQLQVAAALYKDNTEQDPNYDYYSVLVTLTDIEYQNDIWVSPTFCEVHLALPTYAQEIPAEHGPQAGQYNSQSNFQFSYEGIAYTTQIPAYWVTYSKSSDSNYNYIDWSATSQQYGITYGWVFEDYAQFTVGLRVPEGYKMFAYAQGTTDEWHNWYNLYYTEVHYETDYWAYVDPPGVVLPPVAPTPFHYQPTMPSISPSIHNPAFENRAAALPTTTQPPMSNANPFATR